MALTLQDDPQLEIIVGQQAPQKQEHAQSSHLHSAKLRSMHTYSRRPANHSGAGDRAKGGYKPRNVGTSQDSGASSACILALHFCFMPQLSAMVEVECECQQESQRREASAMITRNHIRS